MSIFGTTSGYRTKLIAVHFCMVLTKLRLTQLRLLFAASTLSWYKPLDRANHISVATYK